MLGIPGVFDAVDHFRLAAFAEVDAAGQFTQDQNIHAGDPFRFQGRVRGHGSGNFDGAEVGEQAEAFAQTEDRFFRADLWRDIVPFRAADSAEQHGVGDFGRRDGGFRQGNAVFVDGGTAGQMRRADAFHIRPRGGGMQDRNRRRGDFRADAVAGNDDDVLFRHSHCAVPFT